jgi:hypothetical protein
MDRRGQCCSGSVSGRHWLLDSSGVKDVPNVRVFLRFSCFRMPECLLKIREDRFLPNPYSPLITLMKYGLCYSYNLHGNLSQTSAMNCQSYPDHDGSRFLPNVGSSTHLCIHVTESCSEKDPQFVPDALKQLQTLLTHCTASKSTDYGPQFVPNVYRQ